MLIELLRKLLGSVEFSAFGDDPHRLLNRLKENGIGVWGIRRRGDRIVANVLLKDYYKLPALRRKSGIKLRVQKRYGLPFKLIKYRFRVGLAAGFCLFFFLLFFLSSFVWNIDIVGNSKLSDREILAALDKMGLYEGTKLKSIDQKTLRTQLALQFPEIAWASVNLEGCKATINITESIGDKEKPTPACNLVAKYDGIITGLKITKGTIKVKVGQTVKKGELLVSGITEYKDGSASFGPSKGEITAKTERELTCFIPFEQMKEVVSKTPKNKYVLSFFTLKIPLYFGSEKYNYKTETKEKRFESNSMYLPIKLTKTSFYKTELRSITLTEHEAKQAALEQMKTIEENEFKNAEIITREEIFSINSSGVTLVVKISCQENIATEDFMLIYEEK